MDVNSLLGLYTTLFGWQFYDVIWTVLAGTGLALLPILGAIFDGLMQARSSGSAMSVDTDAALSNIEVNVFKIFLVMVLAVIPTGLTTLSAAELRFDSFTPATTDSTYDDTFAVSPLVTSASVEVPAWWYWTMAISQGITKSVVRAAGDDNNFRDLEVAIATASIRDPLTRYQLQVFNAECHTPARTSYYDQTVYGAATFNDDVHWPGSEYLISTAGYYDSINTRSILPGYPYVAASMPEYENDPGLGGRPNCNTFWTNIEDAIYAEAVSSGVSTVWATVTGGISAAERANIVQTYVQTVEPKFLQDTDSANSIRTRDQGKIASLIDGASTTLANVGLAKEVIFLRSSVSAVIYGGEVVQSYILLVLYMFIPVGMLLSRYSFTFLVSATALIFTVTFWTALWSIAAQADAFLTNALFDTSWTARFKNLADPENTMKDLVHNVIVLGLYVLLPLASSWMLIAAGQQAAGYAGRSAMGGNIAGSAGGGVGAARAGRAAYKSFNKGGK